MTDTVFIKGTREGLTITLTSESSGPVELAALLQELERHLGTRGAFFRGGLVALELGDQAISKEGLSQIGELLGKHEMTLRTVVTSNAVSKQAADALGLRLVPGAATEESASPSQGSTDAAPAGERVPQGGRGALASQPRVSSWAAAPRRGATSASDESRGILVRHLVRSGQVVRHTGHVVILGDVNVGGEVVAGGDIVVWGRLRGTAHAGMMGDESAVVCALEMSPMQLRIAHVIARPDDDAPTRQKRSEGHVQAEIAYVRGDMIEVSPWDKVRPGTRPGE